MYALNVIYEDNHLLVVNKPAGIATMGAESGATLHSLGCQYLRKKYNKPGNVYLGVVSRLDALTSGVIVFARTSKAAARLNQQFAKTKNQSASKIYLAIVQGKLPKGTSGAWSDDVYKDDSAHRMRVTNCEHPDGKIALLSWISLHSETNWSLVAVRLETGRKHQIRLQFAHRNHPVLGDQKYQSTANFPDGIGLHSWQLSIEHPTQKQPMHFLAKPPQGWAPFLCNLPAGYLADFDRVCANWIAGETHS